MQKLVHTVNNIYLDFEVKLILWPLTSVSHILTVSNYQVCSDDEFDLWPVYSGERFSDSWPASS